MTTTDALDLTNADIERMRAEDAEPEPDPEPDPQAQGPGEKELKALGRVVDTYFKGLERVMGDDFKVYAQCATCAEHIPGFVPPELDPFADFEADPNTKTCPACHGKTRRKSGATFGDAVLISCSECAGSGYVANIAPAASTNVYQPGQTQVPTGYLPPSGEAMPPRDMWGRQLGHPHFGIDPASIGV